MQEPEIEYIAPVISVVDIDSLTEWEDNPRLNDEAVPEVAASIKKYGFLQPIVVDQFNKVWAGHTRLKALRSLGIRKVPVVRADHLTTQQLKDFAIADNKTHELAKWDNKKLLATVKLEHLREIPGFTSKDMDRLNGLLLKESRIDEIRENLAKGTSKIQHECPQCHHVWTA